MQSQTKTRCFFKCHSQQMKSLHYIPQGIRIGSELSALPQGDKIYSGRPCCSRGDAHHCFISTTQSRAAGVGLIDIVDSCDE